MATLTLVRHGQASFGAADYDQLSELGRRQCEALGRYLHERGRRFSGVVRGSLARHTQSLAALASALPELPGADELPGLNEYDAQALVHAAAGGSLPAAHGPEARRLHFRLLRQALDAWMRGELQPPGMPDWPAFAAGVAAALIHVRDHYEGDVLLVSSGGPIATALAQVLAAPPKTVVALNLQMRNSAMSELRFTASGPMLVTFNTLPHLDHPERAGWVTFA